MIINPRERHTNSSSGYKEKNNSGNKNEFVKHIVDGQHANEVLLNSNSIFKMMRTASLLKVVDMLILLASEGNYAIFSILFTASAAILIVISMTTWLSYKEESFEVGGESTWNLQMYLFAIFIFFVATSQIIEWFYFSNILFSIFLMLFITLALFFHQGIEEI